MIFWMFNIVPQRFEQRRIFISVAKDLLSSSSKLSKDIIKVFSVEISVKTSFNPDVSKQAH